MKHTNSILLLLFLLMSPVLAQPADGLGGLDSFAPAEPASPTPAQLLVFHAATPQVTTAEIGEPFFVAIDYTIDAAWHAYGPSQTYEFALPSRLESTTPNIELLETHFPAGKKVATKDPASGKTVHVYYLPNRGTILAKVRRTATATATATANTTDIRFQWIGQLCGGTNNQCLGFTLKTPVASVATGPASPNPAFIARIPAAAPDAIETDEHDLSHSSLWVILGVAFLAGLTINILPCVLPVIPLRIYSLVEMAGESRRRYVTLSLAFAGGMMLFFVMLVALHVFLKLSTSGASGVSLNLLLTNRAALVTLIAVLVALAANLFGLFNILVPSRIANAELSIESQKEGHGKSLLLGFMMAVLATPCSFGPLAAAMALVQTKSVVFGSGVLLVIGLGMTSPHLLIAAFPSLIKLLPKPGIWMEYFKQSCGFVVLLVAVYLLGVMRGDASLYPYYVLAWCVLLTMGLWIWGAWVRFDAPLAKKLRVRGFAVALVVLSGFILLPEDTTARHTKPEPYSAAAVEAARGQGRVVLVKFESNTCAECRRQEAQIYNTPETAKLFMDNNVAYFKGNIDSGGEAKTFLGESKYGLAVPRTFVYPPGDGPAETTVDLSPEKLQTLIESAAK